MQPEPALAGAAYGFADMGPYQGGQAELLRVPYGDFNALRLGEDAAERQTDYVMLADIFPTGYHATEMANVEPGDQTIVFGAGPVGLMAAYSALLKGAGRVWVADHQPDRLRKAQEIGAIPINTAEQNPAEVVKEATLGLGADNGCECVGYQAHDAQGHEDAGRTLNEDFAESFCLLRLRGKRLALRRDVGFAEFAEFAEFVEEATDPALDLVADGTDRLHALACRVVQLPVQVPLAGEDRAGVAAAHGDADVRLLDRVHGEDLRRFGRDVDAHLGHDRDGGGIDPVAGVGAGGTDLDAVSGQVAQPRRGHLRAAGIVDTDEEHRGLVGHQGSLSRSRARTANQKGTHTSAPSDISHH